MKEKEVVTISLGNSDEVLSAILHPRTGLPLVHGGAACHWNASDLNVDQGSCQVADKAASAEVI